MAMVMAVFIRVTEHMKANSPIMQKKGHRWSQYRVQKEDGLGLDDGSQQADKSSKQARNGLNGVLLKKVLGDRVPIRVQSGPGMG